MDEYAYVAYVRPTYARRGDTRRWPVSTLAYPTQEEAEAAGHRLGEHQGLHRLTSRIVTVKCVARKEHPCAS